MARPLRPRTAGFGKPLLRSERWFFPSRRLDIGEAEGQSEEAAVRRFLDDFRRWHWPEGQALPEIWYDPLSLLLNGPERAVAHAKCVVADERHLFVSSAN